MLARGHAVDSIPAGGNPITTLLRETFASQASQSSETVLHFTADTGPLLRSRSPAVVTVHGVASRWINTARNRRQEAAWRFRVQRAISSVDRIITVSNSSAEDILATFKVPQSDISVIPHGISPAFFEAGASRDTMGETSAPFALYIGNLEPRKNLINLIEAFAKPPMASIGARLVIAGRPAWNYAEILKALEGAENIEYLGFIDNSTRMSLLKKARLFVFPSLYEGFGFPVLEALAAGLPVATSRRGSLAEVAGPSWELSELNADALARDLSRAWQDEDWLTECSVAGPEWARQYNWETSVEKHESVYREII
ncbi:glycosyltransferase family 1 protein [Streptomyces sp. NP160]|uniref:glycosyltransferase family 4 protein n=1 Tax=Streptomyces sp. NP160 TaxID=2586637 RepID=UPI00214B9540|nr:glycosyltransferase family 1 protein [Streptomyces sp. NP160]